MKEKRNMKILITSLLLLVGLNQALARSLPWLRDTLDVNDDWLYDDYDQFRLPVNEPDDHFYKFIVTDSSEESKELERPAERGYQDDLFGSLLGSLFDADQEDTNNNENISSHSNEKATNDGDDHDEDEGEAKKTLQIFLDEIFGASAEKQFSEEITKELEEKTEQSNEDSDPVLPTGIWDDDIFVLTKSSEEKTDDENGVSVKSLENSNESTEITDMTKSSEDSNSNETDDLSEADVNRLASFFFALHIVNDLSALKQAPAAEDDIAKGKEADEILELFSSILDKMINEKSLAKEINSIEKAAHDNVVKQNTAENESSEEDDSNEATTTTAPETDSSASSEENNKSIGSDIDDANFVYVVFKGFNENAEQEALNKHKYSVVNSQQKVWPTSAPYIPENDAATLSTTRAQNSISEYEKIRVDLDTQQDSMRRQESVLDKDFYTIVENNFDDNTLNKFERDIYAAHENLDKIKKNINAMQNLQTKLYFHKLVTTAIKEAQHKAIAA